MNSENGASNGHRRRSPPALDQAGEAAPPSSPLLELRDAFASVMAARRGRGRGLAREAAAQRGRWTAGAWRR